MNYSQVERDNIARGNRKAIEILFVLVKILDVWFNCNFNNLYQITINFPFYLRDLVRGPNRQTFNTKRMKRIDN